MSDEFDPSDYGVDPVDHANSAFTHSVFNGLVALFYALAERGVLGESDLRKIHNGMSKPLGLGDPKGDNLLLAQMQSSVDTLLADLLALVSQRKS